MAKTALPVIRWDRIAKARALVESGFMDDPDVQQELLVRSLDPLIEALDKCPIGDGNQYRDVVASALGAALAEVVDVPLMRKEVSINGGRADIELPVRIERLDVNPVWASWHRRYELRCVVVESKNLRGPSRNEDVSQLVGYLQGGGRGRFGMLVSRNGFTRNAFTTLSATAKMGSHLVIPFDNKELCAFVKMSGKSSQKASEFLRRKETLLLQAS